MKTRHTLLLAVLIFAGGLAIFGDKTPTTNITEAVARNPSTKVLAAVRPGSALSSKQVYIQSVHPRVKLVDAELMGASSTTPVFASQNWAPPPPPPSPPVVAQPAPIPTAPPLPFVYLGKSLSEGIWEVFLAQGERIIIVKNNSLVDGIYRIDAIVPPTMSLTYLPLNQAQQLIIGVLD